MPAFMAIVFLIFNTVF